MLLGLDGLLFLIRALLGELYCSQADLISYTGFGYVDVVLGKKKVKMCASWGFEGLRGVARGLGGLGGLGGCEGLV